MFSYSLLRLVLKATLLSQKSVDVGVPMWMWVDVPICLGYFILQQGSI